MCFVRHVPQGEPGRVRLLLHIILFGMWARGRSYVPLYYVSKSWRNQGCNVEHLSNKDEQNRPERDRVFINSRPSEALPTPYEATELLQSVGSIYLEKDRAVASLVASSRSAEYGLSRMNRRHEIFGCNNRKQASMKCQGLS